LSGTHSAPASPATVENDLQTLERHSRPAFLFFEWGSSWLAGISDAIPRGFWQAV